MTSLKNMSRFIINIYAFLFSALSVYLKHRYSEDLDFFGFKQEVTKKELECFFEEEIKRFLMQEI